MPTPDFLTFLKGAHDAYDRARREILSLASAAQHAAKRAIFALQREDDAEAKRLLAEAEERIEAIRRLAASNARLLQEGAYRAALEEYAEARFFAQLLVRGEASAIEGLDEETQIAGLSDAVGEAVRRMTLLATAGRRSEAKALKERLEEVVLGLEAMDYSGYLRTKYDQARGHLRRAEEILYDLSIHGRE